MLSMSGCIWCVMRLPEYSFAKPQKYSGKTPMVDAKKRCFRRVVRHRSSTGRMLNTLVSRRAA